MIARSWSVRSWPARSWSARLWSVRSWSWCWLGLCACGAGGAAPEARSPLAARLADSPAAAHAPDLIAAARSALQAAETSPDAGGRQLHEQRARLLLRAAEAEAARIELDAAREALRPRLHAAEQAGIEARRAEAELARQLRLQAAEAASLAELQAAFATAAQLQVRGPRGVDDEASARAADALRRRAQMLLVLLQAFGVPQANLRAVQASVDAAERGMPKARLRAALTALDGARRALGEARAGEPGPRPGARNSLLQDAAARGLSAHASDAGVRIELQDAFRGGRVSRDAAGTLRLARGLLLAFPHGQVRIEHGAAAPGIARARVTALRRALSLGDRAVAGPVLPEVAPTTLVLTAY